MHPKLAVGGAALAAAMALAAPVPALAAPAKADTTSPLTLSFDHVVLDTPGTGDAALVSDSTQPLTVTAEVDPTTGDFTIAPSDFHVPAYTFTEGGGGSVTVALKNAATGNIDDATGALTLNADFLTTLTSASYGSCVIDTGALTLSTATTQPLAGVAFPTGATGIVSGNGAFGSGWSTLAPGTGSACSLINQFVDGPGGIWVSRGIAPKAPAVAPKLSLTVSKPVTVKLHQTATIRVLLANTGGADTASVKVCLTAKAPLSPTRDCKTVAAPAADSTHALSFRLSTKKATAGKHQLKLTVAGKTQTLTLKVLK
jgi:hypothetical protein